MSLMVSISGIRGIVGTTLTPEVIVRYAAAFGEYCRRKHGPTPTVILGRDGRITGRAIADIVSSTLITKGVNVRAIGICPTPTVQIAVERTGAAGGIAITASHNPMEWNGLKFMSSTGMFLDVQENREFWALADSPASYVSWKDIGTYTEDNSWLRKHIDAVLALPFIDRTAVARRKFRVVADCVNAAGGLIVPALLREFGCDLIGMNCEVSGVFQHTPEPIPENLTDLGAHVNAEHADLGIAVDPDVDRLVLFTERGEPYGEEYTITSVVKFILSKHHARGGRKATVVVNLSTTRAVDDVAREFGATMVRTPVGEINVAKRMRETGALVGGEGSGGVILPAVHLGRDAIVGIGLILQMLTESGGTLSALRASLPQYAIAKGKVELGPRSPDDVLRSLKDELPGDGTVNTDDGLKVDYPDSWVHLRKSNTEPIIRIIAEARSADDAAAVVKTFRERILALGR